jgi:hypothetical protein
VLAHPAIFNAAFATIQLALAIGLLWRATTRLALAASIVWGLGVWWLGEALGGLLAGNANPVTGAPGGALLYVVIAVLAWPRRPGDTADRLADSVAAGSRIGRGWAQVIWAVLWAALAGLVLQPGVRAPGVLRGAIGGQAAGEPGWIAALDRWAASAIGSHPFAISLSLAIIFLVIAGGIFVPAATRPVLILSALAALAIWVVGEDFGGILTGQGTDPNTGPLLILLAAAYWPFSRKPRGQGLNRTYA